MIVRELFDIAVNGESEDKRRRATPSLMRTRHVWR